MPEPAPDLERRVERLEQIIERAIAAAQGSPFGRKILAMLGLSP